LDNVKPQKAKVKVLMTAKATEITTTPIQTAKRPKGKAQKARKCIKLQLRSRAKPEVLI